MLDYKLEQIKENSNNKLAFCYIGEYIFKMGIDRAMITDHCCITIKIKIKIHLKAKIKLPLTKKKYSIFKITVSTNL